MIISITNKIIPNIMQDELEGLRIDIITPLINLKKQIDEKRNVVIHNPVEMNKIISIVQQLIGRGVITSEEMINDSIINGTPIIRNLNPGFKKFVEDLLASKGVKEFKTDKKRKQKNKGYLKGYLFLNKKIKKLVKNVYFIVNKGLK